MVSGEGPVEAGNGGPTLTCTVRETISGLSNMPSAHWIGPSGLVEDGESVTLTETANDVTVTITLTSLHYSPHKLEGTPVKGQ